ncbi:MAG: hypothetical protein JWO11_1338 [Nocardioides sp.]|nr:hypothetical protein [Nocardioides sp.]
MNEALTEVDPFDLPEWLGESDVTWAAASGVRTGHHVRGSLTGDGHADVACDLFAVDEAYPAPVADDRTRLRAHQAWRHGQVLLVRHQDRLALAVPGTSFTADLVLDALDRLARAVGSSADHYTARLRIGTERGTQRR